MEAQKTRLVEIPQQPIRYLNFCRVFEHYQTVKNRAHRVKEQLKNWRQNSGNILLRQLTLWQWRVVLCLLQAGVHCDATNYMANLTHIKNAKRILSKCENNEEGRVERTIEKEQYRELKLILRQLHHT